LKKEGRKRINEKRKVTYKQKREKEERRYHDICILWKREECHWDRLVYCF
jgi:hypothetical protein